MGRRLAVLLLATCLVVPAIAFAAEGDPKERFTAADQARARSFLLKRQDLNVGWKSDTGSPDSDVKCAGYDPDLSDLTLTGEAESNFEHDAGLYLGSYASVYKSNADAKASWARVITPALARCLRKSAQEAFGDEKVSAKVISSVRIPFAKVAERVAAFRLRFTVSGPGVAKPIPFTLHMIGLGNGRADVLLMAMAPFKGFRDADLELLAARLSQRMAAANV